MPSTRRTVQMLDITTRPTGTVHADPTTTTDPTQMAARLAHQLNLRPEAAKILKVFTADSTDPLYIIALVGKSRLGKSTLAKMLVVHLMRIAPEGSYTDAEIEAVCSEDRLFEVVAGANPITTGVQFWGEAIPRVGGGKWMVIDTEGTDQGSDVLTGQLTAVFVVPPRLPPAGACRQH